MMVSIIFLLIFILTCIYIVLINSNKFSEVGFILLSTIFVISCETGLYASLYSFFLKNKLLTGFFLLILLALAAVLGYILNKWYVVKSYKNYVMENKKYKKYILNNVKYKINHPNGLVENYVDGQGVYYTLNGKIITNCDDYQTLITTDDFFLIALTKKKTIKEEYTDWEDGSILYRSACYPFYTLTLYDYDGKVVDNVEFSLKDIPGKNFKYVEELNNEYIIFGTKFLYSKSTGSIKKIENDEKESLNANTNMTLEKC